MKRVDSVPDLLVRLNIRQLNDTIKVNCRWFWSVFFSPLATVYVACLSMFEWSCYQLLAILQYSTGHDNDGLLILLHGCHLISCQ